MKKPEEIKKGLECCDKFLGGGHWNICSKCPYDMGKGRCYGTMMADALAYIQQLEAQVPRWIPVEERLPATDDDVLIVTNNEFGTGYEVGQGYYDICDEEWFGHAYVGTIDVTHWMPLPKAPKEDAQ